MSRVDVSPCTGRDPRSVEWLFCPKCYTSERALEHNIAHPRKPLNTYHTSYATGRQSPGKAATPSTAPRHTQGRAESKLRQNPTDRAQQQRRRRNVLHTAGIIAGVSAMKGVRGDEGVRLWCRSGPHPSGQVDLEASRPEPEWSRPEPENYPN